MANRFCPQFYRFISFQTENKVFLSKISVYEINTNYTNSVYSPLDWLGKFYLGRFAVMNCDVYNEYLLLQIFANWIWQFLRRKCEQGAHFAVSVCDKSTIKFAKIHILPNWLLPFTKGDSRNTRHELVLTLFVTGWRKLTMTLAFFSRIFLQSESIKLEKY